MSETFTAKEKEKEREKTERKRERKRGVGIKRELQTRKQKLFSSDVISTRSKKSLFSSNQFLKEEKDRSHQKRGKARKRKRRKERKQKSWEEKVITKKILISFRAISNHSHF